MIKSKFLLILALLISPFTQAVQFEDITLPDTLVLEEQELTFHGAGLREKFFMDLYVGSFYSQFNDSDANKHLNATTPSAIRLNIVSSLITSEKMTDAVNEGFADATGGNTSTIEPQIKQFLSTFSAEIKEGDQFTILFVPNSGVTVFKNEQKINFIEGEAFRVALMKIWLGDEPAQESLKEGMLGLD